eukprot:TRINITY_DN41874_c0_g1_i1.p1 TRINITY_DN41874_c0_g1~~TRINITY_DN41874_c0_g1_i1.p1  ORF type:complete len:343 (+),score=60.92 TRINITY_DN41874_c0_g1_i1:63-1091(+)
MSGDTEGEDAQLCRICFDGPGTEALIQPCKCKGTQAFVHEACLLNWRRLQILQGLESAARKCEICGTAYAQSLAQPTRPLWTVVQEYLQILADTLLALALFGGLPHSLFAATLIGLCSYVAGFRGLLQLLAVCGMAFPVFVLILFLHGVKLSILGSAGSHYLAFTSFGAPVEGLEAGHTVAVILNNPIGRISVNAQGGLRRALSNDDVSLCEIRDGGPLQVSAMFCIHSVPTVPYASKIVKTPAVGGSSLYLSRSRYVDGGSDVMPQIAKSVEREQDHHAVLFRGLASWGPHQLEGEVRRGAWGWLRHEDVKPEDVMDNDLSKVRDLWKRLVRSPKLQIFQS